jgi:hypothetical protein
MEGERWKKQGGLMGHAFLFVSLREIVLNIYEVS